MKKYSNVVPIGFFCGIAQELERIGLRNCSYPIDWLITEFEPLINCISNNFQDFLNIDYLEKDLTEKLQKHTYVVRNTKYDLKFFHDFEQDASISEQLPGITEKYNRRIARFYKNIKENSTLFIRYIKNEKEYKYISENYDEILNWLKSYNEGNNIIYVINSDILIKQELPITIFSVKKDENDSVSRKCFKKNKSIPKYICKNVEYNSRKKFIQTVKYAIKAINNKKTNLIDKIKKKIRFY